MAPKIVVFPEKRNLRPHFFDNFATFASMLRPNISDYLNALENPAGIFRTLGEPRIERDVWGVPDFRAGNSAAIFKHDDGEGRRRLLKCYIRPNRHLRAIYDYIERHHPPILPSVRLLQDEMFVHTADGGAVWVDIVEGEWTEGTTLEKAVAGAVKAADGTYLTLLADAFDALRGEISTAEWAHGDLKPENIVVRPDGSLVLIDCDAMWIPELAGQSAAELGTPPYRDPARTPVDFDKTIDDHPARLIASCLRALASRPSLWPDYTTFEELEIL